MRAKLFLGAVLIAFIICVALIAFREARSDRAWDTEVSRTSTGTVNSDGTATLENVRDFTYGDGSVASTTWESSVTVRPDRIKRVWFVLEPFAKWKAVGHTFLTFEFDDGSAYSFSVEARREQGESYSALKGLFNEYELAYIWGTERDFVTRRLLYLKHPVRMYPLAVDAEGAQALFKGLIERTDALATKPRFYNTVTANCTNVLAQIANEVQKDSVPLDLSWFLPGYSDLFLMRIGLIATEGSVAQTQEHYDITPYREELLPLATDPLFGKQLRDRIGAAEKN